MKYVLTAFIAVLVGIGLMYGVQEYDLHHTETVCTMATIDTSYADKCGKWENITHTEYICGQYSCWLEIK